MNNKLYAFVHVPKTGGASIKYSLDQYLCKHLNVNMQHLPTSFYTNHNHDHIYFSFIRDPYDRACSDFFYIKRQIFNQYTDVKKWDIQNKSRFRYLKNISIDEYLENFEKFNSYGSPSVYSKYFDSVKIQDFDFVGHTSDMRKSILLANSMFNITIKNKYINLNPSNVFGRPYNFKYSKEMFKKHCIEDYEIYNLGLEKFTNLCNKHNIN